MDHKLRIIDHGSWTVDHEKKIVSLRSLDGREAKLSSPAGPFTELVDASKYLYREMRLSKKRSPPLAVLPNISNKSQISEYK